MKNFILIAVWVGIAVVAVGCSEDPMSSKPEPTRFTHTVVADGLDEPFQLEFDDQGHVYWIERTGAIKRIDETTGRIDALGSVSLYDGRAPGLIGVLLDQNFQQTRHLYLYYSAAEDDGNMRLSRFTLESDTTIDKASEVVMVKIPWEQPDGQHFGGGMTWDTEGNLLLSVGGDTRPSQYEPIHSLEEDDRRYIQDAARTSGNSNDLRGTILRITPQPDGSYTIPVGNLFPKDTPKTRPEIYAMGTRNPWRLSVDSETGYLHWGEVGPDAGVDSKTQGPMGYDEFNVARSAGNFGWPFVIGKNRPYPQYDYGTQSYGHPHDPETPVNRSPNNTGLQELPPAQPALIAYPYRVSDEWPILGSAARSAVGGPVFRQADFSGDAPRVFPGYFEGKWLVTDYVRNWIMVVTMNDEGTEATDIERLMPSNREAHQQPLDMDFGPTGDLYLVEYGSGSQGRISKYEYNAGNRVPVARAEASQRSGGVPFEVDLSSDATVDYDEDELQYEWAVHPTAGGASQEFTNPSPTVSLSEPGRYEAVLTVTDAHGAADRDSLLLVAGNERPEVTIKITDGNRSFYFPGDTISYEVRVNDQEDGTLESGDIANERVHVTAEYVPSGLSPSHLEALMSDGGVPPQTPLRHVQAQRLIRQSTCQTCHRVDSARIGPSFTAVADKYDGTVGALDTLTESIREGSMGTWGETPMPPQTTLSESEVRQISNYILSLSRSDSELNRMPSQGAFVTEGRESDNGGSRLHRFFSPRFELGSYVFRARYTDNGSPIEDGLSLTGDDQVLLRYPLLAPETADVRSETGISYTPSSSDPGFIVSGSEAYIGFEQIDLTGIGRIQIGALTRFWHWSHFTGGIVELRLDSPTGPLVGKPHRQFQPDSMSAADGPFFGDELDDPVEVDVSAVRGQHDVYIVFRNPDATADDAMLVITGIEFET